MLKDEPGKVGQAEECCFTSFIGDHEAVELVGLTGLSQYRVIYRISSSLLECTAWTKSQIIRHKFPKEAVIYLSLEHPNIARLFDVYEDEEQALSFVMKFENQPFKTQLLNTHAQGAKIFWHSATSYHHISIRPR